MSDQEPNEAQRTLPLFDQVPKNCRSCGAPVHWIKMKKSGKWISLDHTPIRLITQDGEMVHGYKSHFATCPQADKWRKKKTEGETK